MDDLDQVTNLLLDLIENKPISHYDINRCIDIVTVVKVQLRQVKFADVLRQSFPE